MGKFLWVAIGAGLMYFLDPEHGSERQSTWKQKLDKWKNRSDMFGSAGMGGSSAPDYATSADMGSASSTGTTGNTFSSQRAA